MTRRLRDAATSYEVRLGEHLDQHWSTWFDGFTLTLEEDGTTTLRGEVRDQSELHGLLDRIRNLGTTLVSVTLLGPPPTTTSTSIPEISNIDGAGRLVPRTLTHRSTTTDGAPSATSTRKGETHGHPRHGEAGITRSPGGTHERG